MCIYIYIYTCGFGVEIELQPLVVTSDPLPWANTRAARQAPTAELGQDASLVRVQ